MSFGTYARRVRDEGLPKVQALRCAVGHYCPLGFNATWAYRKPAYCLLEEDGRMEMRVGLRAEVSVVVGREDTAVHLGSGDVPVLGTPRLLAIAEAATVKVVEACLDEAKTSVGTRVELEHLAASPVGTRVTVEAELEEVDGAWLVFAFSGRDERGTVVGKGRIERIVVDRGRFLGRLPR